MILRTKRMVLREITRNDAAFIVNLRSDEAVYRYFIKPHKVTIDEHLHWFNNSYLNNDSRHDFVAYVGSSRVGVFSIASDEDSVEVSYILAPEYYGRGYAKEAVCGLLRYARNILMKKYAIATIHKDNIKSIEFIGKCGFTRYSENGDFCIYKRELKAFKQVVAIRADANEVVGTGHIMRCISIASKITSYGVGCVFITADNKSDAVLREYEHVALGSQYNDMDSELERLEKVISADGITSLLVDSYYVTRSYLGVLKTFCNEKGIKLIYIDDVLSFPYACNTLINYNIYADEVSYRRLYAGTKAPKLCLGVSYAPLRDEFLNTGGVIKAGARDIMISTGGADTEHICLGMIKEIGKQAELSKYHFHCIIGAMNGDRDEIRALAVSLKNVILYENVRNMSAIMNKCDVAISAAGSTLYELSATKTPAITYVLADNQISGAKKFEELGIMRYCGDVRGTSMTTLCRELLRSAKELIESYELRCKMAEKMATIVDGRGAGRIAYEIINTD